MRKIHSILNIAAEQAGDGIGPAAALVFYNRLIRLDAATGQKELIADGLVTRSVLLRRAGRFDDAVRDLDKVHHLAASMTNPSSKHDALAVASVAEAFIYRDHDDQRVVQSLSRAIDLYRRLDRRSFLAQLLLERGRAHSRRGERVQAEADYRAGVAEVEYQRGTVGDSTDRISYFDRAEELFVDLAANALRDGHREEAFDWLERGRARELLDQTSRQPMQPMSSAELRSHLPAGVALVTHTVTKASLITCILTRREVRVFEEPVRESRLTALVNAIDEAFANSAKLPKPELRELAQLLTGNVHVAPGTSLVFVPDRFLNRVPFAALLQTNGRYLVEDYVLSVSPSATQFVRNAERATARTHPPSILLLASPQIPSGFDLPPLPNARREATRISKFYAKSLVLDGSDPNATSLLSIASSYDVLHYGGHTLIDDATPGRSCLFVGEHGRISLADIEHAQLSQLRLVVLGGCNTGVGRSHRTRSSVILRRPWTAGEASPFGPPLSMRR